jgi:putative transposase
MVLDEILQFRRDTAAAKWLLKTLTKRYKIPRRIEPDKQRSYGAAKGKVAPNLKHWFHKDLNNCAENSHLPFRKRERCMQGLQSPGGLQRFVSCHSAVRNHFFVPSRRHSALQIRYHRMKAFDTWKVAACIT